MSTTGFYLGYWLALRNVELPARPSLAYRGLDRDTSIPLPEMFSATDGSQLPEDRLSRLRDDFWDARESFELNTEIEIAKDLRDRFREEGIDVEVIFGEVVDVPRLGSRDADLEARLAKEFETRESIHSFFSSNGVPAGRAVLGLDVSDPVPSFHSTIFQPNLEAVAPTFVESLNENGLFDDLAVAQSYAGVVNQTETSRRPFCVVEVSIVPVD